MAASFLDSNVLLYLGAADDTKSDRAEALVATGGTISIQVLNEVANVARRKMAMSWTEMRHFLGILRELLDVRSLTVETHDLGIAIAERNGFSIFDSMIIASALLADCDILWTEDLQHGQVIEGRLRIVNPFKSGR